MMKRNFSFGVFKDILIAYINQNIELAYDLRRLGIRNTNFFISIDFNK